MKRLTLLAIIGAVGILAAGSLASQQTTTYKATLNAAQVVPHPKGTTAAATGTFTATLTGTTLKWRLTYTHLTGPAGAAHIHLGARGKNGIALVALCGPCKSPISGTANSVTDDVGALMAKAGAYVNVHTTKNPEGEIRGEITGH
jgi:hypothetical protein